MLPTSPLILLILRLLLETTVALLKSEVLQLTTKGKSPMLLMLRLVALLLAVLLAVILLGLIQILHSTLAVLLRGFMAMQALSAKLLSMQKAE